MTHEKRLLEMTRERERLVTSQHQEQLAAITAKLREALGDKECEGCNGDKTFDAGKDRPRINCSQCRGTGRISAADGLSVEQMVDAMVEKQKKMDEEMDIWARAPDIDRVEKTDHARLVTDAGG